MDKNLVTAYHRLSQAWSTVRKPFGGHVSTRREQRVDQEAGEPANIHAKFAYDKLREALQTNVDEQWGPMTMFKKASYAVALAPGYACARSVQALACMYYGQMDAADAYNRVAFELEPGCELAKQVQSEIEQRRKLIALKNQIP